MSAVREVGRVLSCLIFSALLVLLVPSSAWSANTVSPRSSVSLSSLAGSSSVLVVGNLRMTHCDPATDPACASDDPTPTPTPTPEPSPAPVTGTQSDPTIVRLDDESTSLLLLTACLLAVGIGARIVGSFGGR